MKPEITPIPVNPQELPSTPGTARRELGWNPYGVGPTRSRENWGTPWFRNKPPLLHRSHLPGGRLLARTGQLRLRTLPAIQQWKLAGSINSIPIGPHRGGMPFYLAGFCHSAETTTCLKIEQRRQLTPLLVWLLCFDI